MKKLYFAMAGVNHSHGDMFCKSFDRLYKAKEAIQQIMENSQYKVFSIERHIYTGNAYSTDCETKTVLQIVQ